MTRKILKIFSIILFASFILSLTACDDLFGTPSSVSTSTGGSTGGGSYTQRAFYTVNFSTDQNYLIQARLLGIGTHCNIWVDTRSNISASAAQNLANTYDNTYRPNMLNAFGVPLTYDGIQFNDPLALADYYGNGNGKLDILLVFDPIHQRGGYFWPEDLYMDHWASNQSDIIKIFVGNSGYIDAGTVVHEVQHIMNYVTGIALRGHDGWMDIWINEGLSAAAEWIGTASHNVDRVYWFNDCGSGEYFPHNTSRLALGNNFFVWGNHANNPDAIFDDYATVYLFFNWMRLQTGSNTIFKAITSSQYYDYNSVTTAMNAAMPGINFHIWSVLLETWMYANFFNSNTGIYGYRGDPLFSQVLPPFYLINMSTVSLFPGEGVFSQRNTHISSPANINRLYYNQNLNQLNRDNPGSNGVMLTYNSSTNIYSGSAVSAALSQNYQGNSEAIYNFNRIIPETHASNRYNEATLRMMFPRSYAERPRLDLGDLLRRQERVFEE